MPNPLDFRGPEFLLLYACLGVAVLVVLYLVLKRREDGRRSRLDTSDPYLIACLRGGANEAARVATVSLIDRGLLKESGGDVLEATEKAPFVRRNLERALIRFFGQPQPIERMFKSPEVMTTARELDTNLAELGLVPDAAMRAERRTLLTVALFVLIGLAALKIYVAIARGHSNILFLIFLAGLFGYLCWKLVLRARTRRGDEMLADLRRLFSRLLIRASGLKPGGASADAVMLAAVYGISALPHHGFGYAHRIFRKAEKGGDGSGSSCGSSCGSSSGGSGSGGDGGGGSGCGGCGGGGGGCGGGGD